MFIDLRQAEVNVQILAEIASDLEIAMREFRPRLTSESPPWMRNHWASLRVMRTRLEQAKPQAITVAEAATDVGEDEGDGGL